MAATDTVVHVGPWRFVANDVQWTVCRWQPAKAGAETAKCEVHPDGSLGRWVFFGYFTDLAYAAKAVLRADVRMSGADELGALRDCMEACSLMLYEALLPHKDALPKPREKTARRTSS